MDNNNFNEFISTNEDPEELFQLLEKLGQGTYGSVYKAFHKSSGKTVAAKIMSVEGDPDLIER
jgi:serine/threonine protein kinase